MADALLPDRCPLCNRILRPAERSEGFKVVGDFRLLYATQKADNTVEFQPREEWPISALACIHCAQEWADQVRWTLSGRCFPKIG